MKQSLPNMLSKVSEFKTQKERIEYLQSIDHPILRQVLQHLFMEELKWNLPEGAPPFKPFEFDEQNRLWSEVRRFYLFTKDGNPNLSTVRREQIFIEMLENVPVEEARFLIHIKDQKSPYPKLTKKLVEKAYPGIFDEKK